MTPAALYYITGAPGAGKTTLLKRVAAEHSYLRGQADALGLEVLDTTGQDIVTSAAALAHSIRQFADLVGVSTALERRTP